MASLDSLLYDWNSVSTRKKKIELNDETLRDGHQATYIVPFGINKKKKHLQLLHEINVHSANIGFPIASSKAEKEVLDLTNYVKKNRLDIDLGCGARALISDIDPALRIIQKAGYPLEIGIFIASSRIRQLIESWELKEMGQMISKAIKHAVGNGAEVMFVTEDTSRAHPDTIGYLYKTAIDSGAKRICICDTVGAATPTSVRNLLKFIYEKIVKELDVLVDWHGHNDRGLALANALVAVKMGVDRIQATALGIGERAGNIPMEELMINLFLEDYIDTDLKGIETYANFAAESFGLKIRPHAPIIGDAVFSTATGVHAAAIRKAFRLGRNDLAGKVYTAVDPAILNKKPDIQIGPMSGKANAYWVLEKLKVENITDKLIGQILSEAKSKNRFLKDREVKTIVKKYKSIR